MHLPDPKLPPMFAGHGVKAPEQPFEVAIKGALTGTLGAGDVIWARTTSAVDLAFVFEPEIASERLGEMRVLIQAAIIDCLGVLMPSQTAVQIDWPDAIACNGALIGTTRFLRANTPEPSDAPDWLVCGVRMDLTRDLEDLEPGLVKNQSSLQEEDGGDLDRTRVIESLAAHVLSAIHDWESDGVRPIVDRWVGRLLGYKRQTAVAVDAAPVGDLATGVASHIEGEIVGVGDAMELMVRLSDGTVRMMSEPIEAFGSP